MKTKRVLGFVVCMFVFLFFAGCKDSPTTPKPPLADNVFKITSLYAYSYSNCDGIFTAFASWQNYDDVDATVTGQVDFGDGVTRAVTGPNLTRNSSSGNWESYRVQTHVYAAKGTYTVTFTLTAHFKRGDIMSSFSTAFEIK